jgi:putative DNA primase/helicase
MPARGGGYGRAALEREAARVAVAAQGRATQPLMRRLLHWPACGRGEVDRAEAESMLLAAAQSCGLAEGEGPEDNSVPAWPPGCRKPRTAPEKPHKAQGTGGKCRVSVFRGTERRRLFPGRRQGRRITPEWFARRLGCWPYTRNADNVDWGMLIEVVDPDGVVKTWAMPMAMTAGSGEEYRAVLNDLGLTIAPGRKGCERLDLFLKTSRPRVPGALRFPRRLARGHVSFCLTRCSADTGRAASLAAEGPGKSFPDPWNPRRLATRGGRILRRKTRGWSLAVSAALAATLLALAGAESGGFHFVGGSSKAKRRCCMWPGASAAGAG